MKEISYKLIKKIATLSSKSGWTKELNLISWNGQERKFDLRSWDENHVKMSKGITLTKDELFNLKELLNKINIDEIFSGDNVEDNSDNDIDDIFDD